MSSQSATGSAKFVMFITALTAWTALALQQYILIDNTPGNGLTPLGAVARFLIFFTVLTNILVAVSLSTILLSPASRLGRFFAQPSTLAAIGVYIFIVGVIYNVVLRRLWSPQGSQKVADELLHVAVPVMYTIYWFVFAAKDSLKWSHIFRWLLYPAIYLVYALVRAQPSGFFVYPFLDYEKLGEKTVFINCLGILALFIFIGLIFVTFGKYLHKSTK